MSAQETSRTALITGTAGFIGFHLARRLLEEGWRVTGIDGMTPYYDVSLKHARHAVLSAFEGFTAHEVMLEDADAIAAVFEACQPDVVVHLAAQAGVRYSLENPRAYIDANLVGTFNVMEGVRLHKPAHFLLASTSSVYGANEDMPFGENDRTDHQMTLYAATKKATENMAHCYSHLWGTPTTALRFFTVYGPWGRPDMALFKFCSAMLKDEPIEVYGEGRMQRDFTYIEDLVEAIFRLIPAAPVKGEPVSPDDSLSPAGPYRVVNIGGAQPVGLMAYIEALEKALGREAKKKMLPMQKGDVRATHARPELLRALTGYTPQTPVAEGVKRFVDWYLEEYAERS
ncbi:SDR family NAD(P)-dependent oxidoreductase [Afifella sp. IM 167]|uniref:SDR family NAD(P)-dependent oxidoreductase n=1 Tax=Afifella sp. IM 167 TaxID=2033586 RepID=UPI001CCCF4A5|nr:SDR family NAD(P)-dependent oxidoreductase [Afifella sp. IM 167]MBZ8134523.1 UDP-glucuronate 5-epimerase [Afifella sp. IM 167]